MTADELAELAAEAVREAGGEITFAEYDAAMRGKTYWAPFSWIAGWGLSLDDKKRNHDKMAAFVACRLKLIEQTDTGYKIVEREK